MKSLCQEQFSLLNSPVSIFRCRTVYVGQTKIKGTVQSKRKTYKLTEVTESAPAPLMGVPMVRAVVWPSGVFKKK